MSKQFYIYVLPSDLERLMNDLRDRLDVRMLAPVSQAPVPIQLESPMRKGSLLSSPESVSCDCCLVPASSEGVPMRFYPRPAIWRVSDDSEAINVTGCDFDEKTLVQGRFSVRSDILIGMEIVRKREAFLKWADQVFAFSKKHLYRSKTLNAYVGEDAMIWEKKGGRYASLALPGREPIYEQKSVSGEQ